MAADCGCPVGPHAQMSAVLPPAATVARSGFAAPYERSGAELSRTIVLLVEVLHLLQLGLDLRQHARAGGEVQPGRLLALAAVASHLRRSPDRQHSSESTEPRAKGEVQQAWRRTSVSSPLLWCCAWVAAASQAMAAAVLIVVRELAVF